MLNFSQRFIVSTSPLLLVISLQKKLCLVRIVLISKHPFLCNYYHMLTTKADANRHKLAYWASADFIILLYCGWPPNATQYTLNYRFHWAQIYVWSLNHSLYSHFL